KAGASLDKIVLRKQSLDAAKTVVIALNVYDKNGKQVYYADAAATSLAYNSTAVMTLSSGIKLPEGGSYTVSFYDQATGDPIATTLTVK
ncbi:MAG: hypothetical protein IJD35_08190, partial [Clostridia bacterium]|nr:hypothetical protein [Clostridia bacterium]